MRVVKTFDRMFIFFSLSNITKCSRTHFCKPGVGSTIRKQMFITDNYFEEKSLLLGQMTHGSGGGFGSGGSGGHVWVNTVYSILMTFFTYQFFILKVRSGKKFLPHAARFGKRYYQRRKYSQGGYRGVVYYPIVTHHHHPHGKWTRVI